MDARDIARHEASLRGVLCTRGGLATGEARTKHEIRKYAEDHSLSPEDLQRIADATSNKASRYYSGRHNQVAGWIRDVAGE